MQGTGQKITTSNSSFETVRKDTCTWTRPRTCIPLSVRKATCASSPDPAVSGRRTLEAVFQGRRELCKGLAIDALDYDWKKYPVIHIDFTNC